MKKVLLIIYKIEDHKGSEDASGYDIAKGLIQKGINLEIITRSNNASLLKNDIAFKNINIHSVDVPKLLAFYKKKGRGIILYYYLWQFFVSKYIKNTLDIENYSIIHQVNFHTDWAPHFFYKLPVKKVWGPVMHHEKVPFDCILNYRFKNYIGELIKETAKQYFWRIDPFLKKSISKTDRIIYANKNYAKPFRNIKNITHIPLGGVDSNFDGSKQNDTTFRVLSVGRLVNLKGFYLTVKSFLIFSSAIKSNQNATLTIIGKGPLFGPLKNLCSKSEYSKNIHFIEWLPRHELIHHYQNADILLYPSFESQGLVVSEAMACGVPTITIDNTGPHFLSGDTGWVIKRGSFHSMTQELSDCLKESFEEKGTTKEIERMDLAKQRFRSYLCSDAVVNNIIKVYKDLF